MYNTKLPAGMSHRVLQWPGSTRIHEALRLGSELVVEASNTVEDGSKNIG
jgi:hypothetical protein